MRWKISVHKWTRIQTQKYWSLDERLGKLLRNLEIAAFSRKSAPESVVLLLLLMSNFEYVQTSN